MATDPHSNHHHHNFDAFARSLIDGRHCLSAGFASTLTGRPVKTRFEATEKELHLLAYYWATQEVEDYLFHTLNAVGINTSDWLAHQQVGERLNCLEQLLGHDAIFAARNSAWANARATLGEQTWKAVTSSDKDENALSRVQDRTSERLSYLERKRTDVETHQRALQILETSPSDAYVDAEGDMWTIAVVCDSPSEDCAPKAFLRVTTKANGSANVREISIDTNAWTGPPYGLGY